MSVHRIAICDDVAIERDILEMLLHRCDEKLLIDQFSCGEDLLCSQEEFDLVFLDIYMGKMSGMETARILQERDSSIPVVFLTASADYALESYEIHAFDYIVKPLQPERLKLVWERYLSLYRKKPRFLVVNNGGITEKLLYAQIEFLESDLHYVILHMADGTSIRVQGKLDDFEAKLNDTRFLRCHKSFLINLSLTEAMGDDFLMQSGKCVPYRKREKKQMQTIFCEYMKKEGHPQAV